ncbi:ABC transporter permease [Spirosoma utsteinense]|uniref:ABC transport system permease protein n=1 Tax=Spirosoma utsteinense TaxID=2585773 RepID=A0ABR6W3E3_9BACT|nr:ABC transporter permease [Spirosoma utsteinense]MBC3785950.1 putative ABC transport system permease protein [Spirosoma utsteinense]MBC3790648.1 putative ABC transport system permease protein [Spirosoma utsteinense]
MFQNYVKVAWRTLTKNRLYTGINITGLSVSMAACWLITLYVWNELTFDRFHERADSIYRVITRFKMTGSDDGLAVSSTDLGPRLQQTYPEVLKTVRFKAVSVATIRNNNVLTNEGDVYQVDKSVFDVFSYRLLFGSKTALDKPNSAVLTQQMAEKYFGAVDPTGRILHLNGHPYMVTSVLRNLPANTDLRFNILLSWQDGPATAEDVFDTSCFTYVLLNDQTRAGGFRRKLAQFDKAQVAPRIKALGYDIKLEHQLQPLSELHFVEGLFDDTPKGSRLYLAIFSIVAVFILLVACINYMNLYVVQAIKRRKEVGIRKVMGAGKRQLLGQFLGEAFLIMLMSTVLSLGIIIGVRPLFEQLTAIPITMPTWSLVAGGLSVLGVVGLLTGLYPALFLSSAQPVVVLKGQSAGVGRQWTRKSLVILQFTISVILIVSTLIVRQQTGYLRSKDPGFTKDQVLVVNVPPEEAIRKKMQVLKTTLAQNSRIDAVSLGLNPITNEAKASVVREVGGQKTEQMVFSAHVDEAYLDLLHIKLKTGRNFNPALISDQKRAILVNESFVKWMGWRMNQAVGQTIRPSANDSLTIQVIGVVHDYHFASLHNRIEPMMLYYGTNNPLHVLIRLKPSNVELVRSVWESLIPEYPFEGTFLDTSFDKQYQLEAKAETLLSWFSALIILISCLGLFGLVSFTAEQRIKEIGIRKVLGATVGQLVALLARDFMKLVIIGIVIASPIAWYAMHQWLQRFAYRIDIGWWTFLLAGLLAIGIALITISFQAIKAALANPVKSLRTE